MYASLLVIISSTNWPIILSDLKSMASVGLTTLASSGYDLLGAVMGERNINVLCIGHGGGALPLFVASKIRGEGFN